MAVAAEARKSALPRIFVPKGGSMGFTLMEVMVAVVIIAIAMVSVYKLQAQTILTANKARFMATAPMLARIKLADIETQPLEDLNDESGDFGEDFPGYSWKITTDEMASEQFKEDGPALRRIDIEVAFNQDESVFTVSSYRLDY
jgi:general secretion pathway protein I